jgi:hypothetical protein
MSTHRTKCVVCEEECYCCNDTHALGCGESGCDYPGRPGTIDFCSEECFLKLQTEMTKRWAIYKENEENGGGY